MKKTSTRITALIMCALMCVALAACGGKSASVQDYLDKNKTALDAAISAAEQDGTMELDIVARDNSMVYTFKFTSDLGMSNDDAKAALDAGMEQQASTFESTYDELKKVVPSAESIIVEYLDMNGEVITSKEFN